MKNNKKALKNAIPNIVKEKIVLIKKYTYKNLLSFKLHKKTCISCNLYDDRCTYFDSGVQLYLSGNESYM